jgi:hypothetical protein
MKALSTQRPGIFIGWGRDSKQKPLHPDQKDGTVIG